ncbi:hypothetical protein [Crocosphaera sp.]|uniref:hypothetical protein n=1 Tax=Crocosphaera sp. TaxID=2729996 RepID=UPI0026132BF5|nr:hypothetical protein [Crocosphaera sp.]MDJ0581082.1 hypothetical protein [Crocosphaera sp.]
MNVIVIGNQGVGKTSMIAALAEATISEKNKNVRVYNAENLLEQITSYPYVNNSKDDDFSSDNGTLSQPLGEFKQTKITSNNPEKEGVSVDSYKEIFSQPVSQIKQKKIYEIAGTSGLQAPRSLSLSVDLPAGAGKKIRVDWIDTPGEAWSVPIWRKRNPEPYKKLVETVSNSQAVILLVPPYTRSKRKTASTDNSNPSDQLDVETWRTQLENWLTFMRKNCSNVKHFVIAMHKADLLGYDLEKDHENWEYNRQKGKLINWFDYNQHIKETYFDLAYDIIRDHNKQPPFLAPRLFVTSTKNSNLLELPWVYLGSQS